MNISQKKHNTRKTLAVSTAIIFAAIIGYASYAYSTQLWPFASQQETGNPKDSESLKAEDDNSLKTDESEEPKVEEESKYVDSSENAEQIPSSRLVTIDISSLTSENDTVTYSAEVKGAKSGTCSALFTSDIGKPVSDAYDTNNGLCEASIPTYEFDSYGKWTLALRFYNDNTQAKDEASVTLKREQ